MGLVGAILAGGWGVLISHNGVDKELFGSETQTTNNRMELLAAIHGLGATEPGATVSVYGFSICSKRRYAVDG